MKRIFLLLILTTANKLIAQVNLQTGSAVYTYSVFNWQDDKSRLNSAVALNYNSGNGLKVNEIAGNIGQGWSLLGGGSITRMQVGQPDDQLQNDGDGTINDINKYPAGYLYNTVAANQGCPDAIAYYPIFGDQNHVYKQHNSVDADREQDYFSFQFGGRNGAFILKKNSNQGIVIGDNKLKISFQTNSTQTTNQHIRTTIVSFSIQDENGIIYTFSKWGIAKLLKIHPSFPGTNYSAPQPAYNDGGVYYNSGFDEIPLSYNPYIINNWFLTSIQDPLTQRTITLNYITRNCTSAYDDINRTWTGGSSMSNGYLPSKKYIIINHNISIVQIPELASIQYPDGNLVTFNYGSIPRYDYNGDYPMQSINVSYNNRTVSRVLLNTTYFIFNNYGTPNSVSQTIASRLCLKSITGVGVDAKDNLSPIVFDYYTGSNATGDFIPPPFYYAKDIQGYYNGNAMNNIYSGSDPVPLLTTQLTDLSTQIFHLSYTELSTLCFNSNNTSNGAVYAYNTINPGFAKNGLLKTITSSDGGTISYEYQQNIYNALTGPNSVNQSGINSNNYIGGVHVSKVSQTDGGYSNGSNIPITTIYNYVNSDETTTSQWGAIDPNNISTVPYYFALAGAKKHIFSGCSYGYSYPGIFSKEEAVNDMQSQSIHIDEGAIVVNITQMAITSFITNFLCPNYFNPALILYQVLTDVATKLLFNCDDGAQTGYTVTYTNSNLQPNLLPIEFSRVEVLQLNNSSQNIGKTVYEFTDFNDYPLWWQAPSYNIPSLQTNPYSMKQTEAYWAYGLPKKVSVYDASGNLLKQTQNVYDWSNVQRTAVPDQSCNCYVYSGVSLRSDNWSNFSQTSNITYYTNNFSVPNQSVTNVQVDMYNLYTGRVELSETHERVYKPSDPTQYSETVTHYDYNPNNYQVSKVTTTLSNGDKNVKEVYYPVDYTTSGILQNLTNNNLINTPVATYSSVIKNGQPTQQYIGASVTDFTALSNGDIKPSRTLTGRSAQPITGFQFNAANPFNYPNLIETSTLTYSNTGKLIGAKDEGNHHIATIYDYNNRLPVATVVNTDPVSDMPAYSSFETDNLGGFSVYTNPSDFSTGGSPSFITTNAITGNRVYNMVNYSAHKILCDGAGQNCIEYPQVNSNYLIANLNTSKSYILSFWSNQLLSVSNSILTKQAPIINGFTYYEYTISQGNNSVLISGSALLDELRLYPKNSRMKTATYDEILGKTSDCDENNRITYYEYDNLGRLKFVKDENKSIVKMYEYNQINSAGSINNTNVVSYSIIYAHISYENVFYDANGNTFADIVVRFYSDAALTQPYSVNNLVVNCLGSPNCDNGCSWNNVNYTVTANGYSAIIANTYPILYQTSWEDEAGTDYPCTCTTDFTLLPGSSLPGYGYTIQ